VEYELDQADALRELGEDGAETGTILFAYGARLGMPQRLLDATAYAPALLAARNGFMSSVRADGFIGWCSRWGRGLLGPGPLGADVVPTSRILTPAPFCSLAAKSFGWASRLSQRSAGALLTA
jgi:hypothetical protein